MTSLLVPHLYTSLILKFYSDTETGCELDTLFRRINGLKELRSRSYDLYTDDIIDYNIPGAILKEYVDQWNIMVALVNNCPMIDEVRTAANTVQPFVLYLACENIHVLGFGFDRFRVENITDERLSELNVVLGEKFGAKIVRDD